MLKALLLSFVIGLITSSPAGPMGLLCLRRVMTRGPVSGFTSALGIASGYAFWSYVAIHGLAVISYWLEQEIFTLRIAIGLFFFLYGLHGIFNSPKTEYAELKRKEGIAHFLSTFLVVFLNPATVVMFSILFTLFGVGREDMGAYGALEIAAAVFTGSMLFWTIVIGIVHHTRKRLDDTFYHVLSHRTAYVICLFGLGIALYGFTTNLLA